MKALSDYDKPKNQKGLRAFLGTAGYYRRFIPDFARWAGPLFDALKKGAPCVLEWNVRQSTSFNRLIHVLCDEHTLTLPRSGDKLILHTDASMLGLGAVLSVERKGEELPVAYFSKHLTAAEKNYSAVVKAVDHYAIHLLGQEFTVITDHRALTALRDSHKLNGRLMRGALALQAYQYTIKYRPGIHYQNADGLSRQSCPEDDDSLLGETGTPSTTSKNEECRGHQQSEDSELNGLSSVGGGVQVKRGDVEGTSSTMAMTGLGLTH